MGLIGLFVKRIILKSVENVALYKTVEYVDKNHSVKGIVKNSKMKYRLILKKGTKKFKKHFFVFDECDNKKYVIIKNEQVIKLLNIMEHQIGKVTSNKNVFPNFSFNIYLNGKKIGKVKQERSIKIKLDLMFNNWRVEGSLLQYKFNVFDDYGEIVFKVHQVIDGGYVIEYNNVENEIISILISMILIFLTD